MKHWKERRGIEAESRKLFHSLDYFGMGKFTTLNLDGVVDPAAANAFRDGELGRFARSRGMTHFVDWPFNFEVLLKKGGDGMQGAKLSLVGQVSLQGSDPMEVWSVGW
jgi:hypothetical protein